MLYEARICDFMLFNKFRECWIRLRARLNGFQVVIFVMVIIDVVDITYNVSQPFYSCQILHYTYHHELLMFLFKVTK